MAPAGSRREPRAPNFLVMSGQVRRKSHRQCVRQRSGTRPPTCSTTAVSGAQLASLRGWCRRPCARRGATRGALPARRFELVRGVGGKHRTAALRTPALPVSTEDIRAADVPSRRPPSELKVAIGPCRLVDCPGVAVEPLDRGNAGRDGPGGAGSARPAPQVDERAWHPVGECPASFIAFTIFCRITKC